MKKPPWRKAALFTMIAGLLLGLLPCASAQAYSPVSGTITSLGTSEVCLKGRGNCIVYPKTAQLPSGRIVMSFEKATTTTNSAVGEVLPIWKSDDNGDTWQQLPGVPAPAYLTDDPAMQKYVSNWTNPFLYVMPETVGDLAQGTLLLASVVSGEDWYFVERKQANSSWTASNDGDRENLAVALFASTDDAQTWNFVNIVAAGGWQGGGAGAAGANVSAKNTYKQVDPVWEPYLMVYNHQLVAYFSDEDEYSSYDSTTGVATLSATNDTATDPDYQVLVHKTWDGSSASTWSAPVMDVPGRTGSSGSGNGLLGQDRPGMTTVVPTTDGKWLMTFEYWRSGQTNTRYKIADSPLEFFKGTSTSDIQMGTGITSLPYAGNTLAVGGSPVTVALPNGRLVYNASGSGDVWVNTSGASDGVWTQMKTPMSSGYSRQLQPVAATGQVLIVESGGSPVAVSRAHVDLGESAGDYYQIVNRDSGLVLGTGNHITEPPYVNDNNPDVVTETAGSAANPETQLWHVFAKPGSQVQLLNKSGGRAAEVWTGSATSGQKIGQWVDNMAGGTWTVVPVSGTDYVRFQSVANTSLYLTDATPGGQVTLQTSRTGSTAGTQQWQLILDKAPVDKSALQAAVDSTGTLAETDYTSDSWQVMTDALTIAQAVLADDDATQGQVDTATTALTDAIAALVAAPQVDKSALQAAVDSTGTLAETDYTSDSWQVLADALTAAQAVLADDDATQGQVDTATTALTDAVAALVAAPPSVSVSVSGSVAVNKQLSAVVDVEPSDATLAYQWYSDGDAVAGATGASFTVRTADICRQISVTVTASARGESASASGVASGVAGFSDMSPSTEGYEHVCWLAQEGISVGTVNADGTVKFQPNGYVYRYSLAMFLYRMAGSPAYTAPSPSRLSDLATSSEFFQAVNWAVDKGLFTVTTDASGKIVSSANSVVTRGEFAEILQRYALEFGDTDLVTSFTAPDVSLVKGMTATDPYYEQVAWMFSYGITAPGPEGYQPDKTLFRWEFATMAHRYVLLDAGAV